MNFPTVQEKLKFYIFSGYQSTHQDGGALHDAAFRFWKEGWQKIYSKSDHTLNLGDFYRQNSVAVIFYDDEPAALSLHSLFNLKSLASSSHPYLELFNETFRAGLAERDIHTVFSFEYFLSNPKIRTLSADLSIAEVLAGLALRLAFETEAQACVATPRTDVPAQKIGENWGFETIVANQVRRGFPIDLVCATPQSFHPHPDFTVNRRMQILWDDRVDFRQSVQPNVTRNPNKRVA